MEHIIHSSAEQLVHSPEPALAVEGRHVEVVAVDVNGSCNVVADHVEPVELLPREFLPGAAVALQYPYLKVPAHRVGVGRDFLVETANAADERDERCQLVGRVAALVLIKQRVRAPNAQRGQLWPVGLQRGEQGVNHRVGDF